MRRARRWSHQTCSRAAPSSRGKLGGSARRVMVRAGPMSTISPTLPVLPRSDVRRRAPTRPGQTARTRRVGRGSALTRSRSTASSFASLVRVEAVTTRRLRRGGSNARSPAFAPVIRTKRRNIRVNPSSMEMSASSGASRSRNTRPIFTGALHSRSSDHRRGPRQCGPSEGRIGGEAEHPLTPEGHIE